MEEITELLEPAVMDRGLELVCVEDTGTVLRVLVDREGGVDLDEISTVTREVSALLDVHDPIESRYTLEVSSPGINRPLRRPEHFARFIGRKVRVRSRRPIGERRNFVGQLLRADQRGIGVDDGTGAEVFLEFSDIEKANYEHEFTADDYRSQAASRSS